MQQDVRVRVDLRALSSRAGEADQGRAGATGPGGGGAGLFQRIFFQQARPHAAPQAERAQRGHGGPLQHPRAPHHPQQRARYFLKKRNGRQFIARGGAGW